jgi:hypothetical protein
MTPQPPALWRARSEKWRDRVIPGRGPSCKRSLSVEQAREKAHGTPAGRWALELSTHSGFRSCDAAETFHLGDP